MSTPPPPLPKKEEASPPDTPFHTPTSMTLSPQKAPDSTGQVTATVTLVSGSSATTSAETVGRLDPIMIPNLSQTPIFVHTPLNYNLEDDLSTISISRQFEIYLSPTMNENSDLFSLQSSPHIIVMKKLGEIGPLESVSGGDDDNDNAIEFWLKYLEDNNAHIVRSRQVDQLEKYLGKSIPQKIRSLVYIKTLQVRYRLNKESFSSLLKRARNSATSRNQQAYFDTLQNLPFKDVLMIFNYYIGEVVSATSARLDAINDNGGAVESTGHLPPSPFIVNIGKLLRDKVGHLENEEMLFLLLKFNKLFTVNLTRGEFFYKVNRSLETSDLTSGLFVHISKQGIDLQKIIKKWVFSFFQDQITDSSIRLEVLDYFVFEGFDFIIRLILSIFAERSSKIVLMEGSELNKYLNDDATFFSEYVVDFEQVLSFQPDLIKFENEYHLLHANSLNNNSNELINLKEINEDLRIKINDLSTQLKDLSTTHHEILDQSESFKEQLKVAQDERSKLEFTRDEIKNKYELLTMKDNVRNTKRANADFSKRSGELEAQIKQIKESIEKKKAKLEKLQPAVAA